MKLLKLLSLTMLVMTPTTTAIPRRTWAHCYDAAKAYGRFSHGMSHVLPLLCPLWLQTILTAIITKGEFPHSYMAQYCENADHNTVGV